MRYQIFQFSLPADDDEMTVLNEFLAAHRINKVAHYVVHPSEAPQLVFVIEYLDATSPSAVASKSKVDYRAVLSEGEFAIFSQLRDLRKKIADKTGVAVYAVFNNAQLAEMVQRNVKSESELIAIPGIGKTKVENYGAQVLALLADFQASPKAETK